MDYVVLGLAHYGLWLVQYEEVVLTPNLLLRLLLGFTMLMGLKPGHTYVPIPRLSGVLSLTAATMNSATTLKVVDGKLDQFKELSPGFDSFHPLAATRPEEDVVPLAAELARCHSLSSSHAPLSTKSRKARAATVFSPL
jgi:hypothetical protein